MAFTMKRGDTRPVFRSQLTQPSVADPAVFEPVDLTGATVKFLMKKDSTLKVNAVATLVDAAAGQVSYTWDTLDTDTSGTFNVEWEVSWGVNKQTFPNDSYLTVTIIDDLG